MHSCSGPATTVVSLVQDAQEDLDAVDSLQDRYLEFLRVFDAVIGEVANVCIGSLLDQNRTNLVPQVHPYAKMALGVLSCAAKVCFHFVSPYLLLLLSNHLFRSF